MKLFYKKRYKKFPVKQYILNNYIKNGRAVFPLYIEDPARFYEEFDNRDITMADDLADYIEEKVYYIPYKYDICLQIFCPPISDVEKQAVRENIRARYALIADDKADDILRMFGKCAFLVVLAVLFLSSSNYIAMDIVPREMMDIIGWVAAWEAIEQLMFGQSKLMLERWNALQLYNCTIEFYPLNKD